MVMVIIYVKIIFQKGECCCFFFVFLFLLSVKYKILKSRRILMYSKIIERFEGFSTV